MLKQMLYSGAEIPNNTQAYCFLLQAAGTVQEASSAIHVLNYFVFYYHLLFALKRMNEDFLSYAWYQISQNKSMCVHWHYDYLDITQTHLITDWAIVPMHVFLLTAVLS